MHEVTGQHFRRLVEALSPDDDYDTLMLAVAAVSPWMCASRDTYMAVKWLLLIIDREGKLQIPTTVGSHYDFLCSERDYFLKHKTFFIPEV